LAGAAGGGWRREVIIFISDLDLPLPRRGVLSGKSSRTSRRWRLFFVRFQPALCWEGCFAAKAEVERNHAANERFQSLCC